MECLRVVFDLMSMTEMGKTQPIVPPCMDGANANACLYFQIFKTVPAQGVLGHLLLVIRIISFKIKIKF